MPGRRCPRRGLLRAVTHACRLRPHANPCQRAGQGGQTQENTEKAEMEKTMSYSIPAGALYPLGILEKGKVERARSLAMWQPEKDFALVSWSINRMHFTLPCACFLFTRSFCNRTRQESWWPCRRAEPPQYVNGSARHRMLLLIAFSPAAGSQPHKPNEALSCRLQRKLLK